MIPSLEQKIAERRAMPPAPEINFSDLAFAIRQFKKNLPGWWFTIGECSLSRDASCGPDLAGPDADLLAHKTFDDGFHHDGETLEASLLIVMRKAMRARSKFRRMLA